MAWDGKTFHDTIEEMKIYEFMKFMEKEAEELLGICQTRHFGKALGQAERMTAMLRIGFDKFAQ